MRRLSFGLIATEAGTAFYARRFFCIRFRSRTKYALVTCVTCGSALWVSFVVFSCALALVFTFTGAMAAAMMMSVAVQVAIKRHMHVLHRRDMATHFVVEDLCGEGGCRSLPQLKFSSRRPWCGKRLSLPIEPCSYRNDLSLPRQQAQGKHRNS